MAEMDFYFFTGSTYTYLTVNRIERVASEAGVTVRWRPYNLRAILQETGVSPFPAGSAKRRYMWRDIERRAERFGIPFTGEPQHPVDPSLIALRVALVAAEEGWCPEFAAAYYRAWFMDHRPPGIGDNMRPFLSSLGQNTDRVLTRATSDEVSAMLEASESEARQIGLFGSPHFVVGNEVFWGDDRLEEALDWARRA